MSIHSRKFGTYNSKQHSVLFRFDKVRIPRENLLNAVADVTPDGRYESAIKDPEQVGVVCSLGGCLISFHMHFTQKRVHLNGLEAGAFHVT